jgi:hypothetical protein
MTGMNYELFLLETRERTARAERRATLRASLGPVPGPAPLRLFRRRHVIPLEAPVEVTRTTEARGSRSSGQRAARAPGKPAS